MWIDVNDRKPAERSYVLATNANMDVPSLYCCIYEEDKGLFLALDEHKKSRVPIVVTHWMIDPVTTIPRKKERGQFDDLT